MIARKHQAKALPRKGALALGFFALICLVCVCKLELASLLKQTLSKRHFTHYIGARGARQPCSTGQH